ncbi:hypothetical protein [Streptomyces murinus]|nr:hypothetical protein [Streptomyces murinus]
MAKKQQLRNEWRKAPKRAPRREIGRRPTWVYQELRDQIRTDDE